MKTTTLNHPAPAYRWGATKTYQCPNTIAFVKSLEESSWGACAAQTINYIIMDELDKLLFNQIQYIICDPDIDESSLSSILADGATPVYIGGVEREGVLNVTNNIDGILHILHA
jgi:hypothetical protein